MPRLTQDDYIKAHHELRGLWLHARGTYAALSPKQQWYLHDYFRPSKTLTNDELIAHRIDITRRRPNLPSQAGRAFSELTERVAHVASLQSQRHALPPLRIVQRIHSVKVTAVVRPEPDVHKFVRALIEWERQTRPPADPDAASKPDEPAA